MLEIMSIYTITLKRELLGGEQSGGQSSANVGARLNEQEIGNRVARKELASLNETDEQERRTQESGLSGTGRRVDVKSPANELGEANEFGLNAADWLDCSCGAAVAADKQTGRRQGDVGNGK